MTPRPNVLQKRPGVVTVGTPGDARAPWICARACAQIAMATNAVNWDIVWWALCRRRPNDGAGGSQSWSNHEGAARRTIIRIFEILEAP